MESIDSASTVGINSPDLSAIATQKVRAPVFVNGWAKKVIDDGGKFETHCLFSKCKKKYTNNNGSTTNIVAHITKTHHADINMANQGTLHD